MAFNIRMNAPRRSSAIFALNEQQRKTGFLFDNGMSSFTGWSFDLVSSKQDAYPELEDVFYAELGNHFMNKEGNICMAVAEWAVRKQVPVLTIHDSFICVNPYVTDINRNILNIFKSEVKSRCLLG